MVLYLKNYSSFLNLFVKLGFQILCSRFMVIYLYFLKKMQTLCRFNKSIVSSRKNKRKKQRNFQPTFIDREFIILIVYHLFFSETVCSFGIMNDSYADNINNYHHY